QASINNEIPGEAVPCAHGEEHGEDRDRNSVRCGLRAETADEALRHRGEQRVAHEVGESAVPAGPEIQYVACGGGVVEVRFHAGSDQAGDADGHVAVAAEI